MALKAISVSNWILTALAILITVSIFEFTKAFVSYRLGDKMPKDRGRLTLNPFKHIDILGFILLFFIGYGWGKPVDTSALYYKDRKRDTIITYAAPMLMNIIVALSAIIITKIIYITGSPILGNFFVILFLQIMIKLNLSYAFFNILPVYPLSGYKIMTVMLPPNKAMKLSQYEALLQMLLMLLLFMGIIPYIINIPVNFFLNLF